MSILPVYDGVIATAGGGQASASPLSEGINRVVTVASAADSVALPSTQDVGGEEVVVINAAAANSMNVYPATGEKINALAANTAFAMPGQQDRNLLDHCPWPVVLAAVGVTGALAVSLRADRRFRLLSSPPELVADDLGSIGEAELAQDVAHVPVHGAPRHDQRCVYRDALHQEGNDVTFAWRQWLVESI